MLGGNGFFPSLLDLSYCHHTEGKRIKGGKFQRLAIIEHQGNGDNISTSISTGQTNSALSLIIYTSSDTSLKASGFHILYLSNGDSNTY